MMAPLDLAPGWRIEGDYLVNPSSRNPTKISIIAFGLCEAAEITHSPWPDRVAAIIEEHRAKRLGMEQMELDI